MTAPTLTCAELKELKPCADAFERIAKFMGHKRMTAAVARAAGATLDDIEWVTRAVAHKNPDVLRRLRLWQADCAAHVLHFYEQIYPADDRPRNAITTARSFARGEIAVAVWAAASDAARAAAWAARAAAWGVWAATRNATIAASAAATDASWAASAATRDASSAATIAASAAARAPSAAWEVARVGERDWQFDRLIAWLSDNEPTDYPLPVKTAANKAA